MESITRSGPPPAGSESAAPNPWQRRLATAIPWFLLLGFALLAWVLFGDRLQSGTPVNIETVVTLRQNDGDGTAAGNDSGESRDPFEATAMFQASGWVEPDPLPIKATALVNGVVESVAVLEGESVEKGQVLATLIREDFELDLATAESELAALRAQAKSHEAAIDAVKAQIQTLLKKVKAGEMRCLELEDRRDRLVRAGSGSVAEAEVEQAKLMLQTHGAEVAALEAGQAELIAETSRLTATREDFSAKILRAETEVARRQLALDRTEIRSPVDGIVLRLMAVPGQKRMLEMDDHDSATVAILYQPDSLQARIDVPLEEASRLSVGQAVRIRSSFLQDRIFHGTVTRIVGEADLQRNTLQAKVRIEKPDQRLRPEMLCRAEFLSATIDGEAGSGDEGASEVSGQSGGRVALYVPESALFEREGNNAAVWSVSSSDRLERRSLKLGSEIRDRYIRVHEGLRPGDRIVLAPSGELSEGNRVQPQSEEETGS